MWHDFVALAVAVSAGWRTLADLLEAQWLLLDTVQQQGAPTGVVWRLVHPDLPFGPLSAHPDVDVLVSWHGAVVVRNGAPVAAADLDAAPRAFPNAAAAWMVLPPDGCLAFLIDAGSPPRWP